MIKHVGVHSNCLNNAKLPERYKKKHLHKPKCTLLSLTQIYLDMTLSDEFLLVWKHHKHYDTLTIRGCHV